ncbi:MAG: LysR substrate-binding domain-containing protein, partial [Aestuariivirgaceae bacterium]
HLVKKLEDYLGAQLFRRLPRGLLLTETGQVLFVELRDVFRGLEKTMERVVEREAHGALTISVAPMFAVKWLVPRLQQFEAGHPDIDLRISSSLAVIDFHRDGFDAAVRLGKGSYAGLEAIRLFDESVTPMCSPGLLDNASPPQVADDLQKHVLLHDDSLAADADAPSWQAWFDAAGLRAADVSRGPRFSQPDHALQAAIDGAGVVLGWRYLAAADIAAGRLVAPFALALPLRSSFYLVYPEAYADRGKIKQLRAWLIEEARTQRYMA